MVMASVGCSGYGMDSDRRRSTFTKCLGMLPCGVDQWNILVMAIVADIFLLSV